MNVFKKGFVFLLCIVTKIHAQKNENGILSESIKKIYNISSPSEIDQAFQKLNKQFNTTNTVLSREDSLSMDNLCTYITLVQINRGSLDRSDWYIKQLRVGDNKSSSYFRIAKGFESVKNIDKEILYATASIDTGIFYSRKLNILHKNDFAIESQGSTIAASVHLLAGVLIERGQSQKAIGFLDKSIPYCSVKNRSGLELDKASALYQLKQYPQALDIYWALLKKGADESYVKKDIQKNYITWKNVDSTNFDVYYKEQWQKFRNTFLDSLTHSDYKEKAPVFTLRDYSGNLVSLDSLKGRVVVLDFWATWCVPCKASFPAMQSVQNKFQNDKNVVFLFIDTWEYTNSPQEAAQGYLTKNNYSFKALFDLKDEKTGECNVVKSYGVTGVPAKFVIDKDGFIRYKLVGYNGNIDATVEELSVMINTLNKF